MGKSLLLRPCIHGERVVGIEAALFAAVSIQKCESYALQHRMYNGVV